MGIPIQIQAAVSGFKSYAADNYEIDLKDNRPIYALVKIIGWPSVVHYEFRFNEIKGLFVELHIEHKDFSWLGETFSSCAMRIPDIDGHALTYSPEQANPKPNQKRWPSLSISLGPTASGATSAAVMQKLIVATRPAVTQALGHWSKTNG